MKSIKQIVLAVLFALSFTLALALLVNFTFIKDVVRKLNQMQTLTHQLSATYVKMDIPIQIFKNIESQGVVNSTGDSGHGKENQTTYAQSRSEFLSLGIEFKDEVQELGAVIHSLRGNMMLRSLAPFSEMQALADSQARQMNQLLEDALDSLEGADQLKIWDISTLESKYLSIQPDLDSLKVAYNSATSSLINTFILYSSVLLLGLLIGVLVLSFLIYRILGRDLKFVLQGLRQINLHDYDERHLPPMGVTFLEEKEILDTMADVLIEQKFLEDVKNVTSSGYILDDILENLFLFINTTLKTDRVGVAFVDYKDRKIIAEYGISDAGSVLLGPGFEVDFGSTSLSQLLDSKEPFIGHNLEESLTKKPESAALRLLNGEGMKSNMIFPLVMNGTVFAFLFFSSVHSDTYNTHDLQVGQKIAAELSPILDKTYLTKIIFSKITSTFSTLVDQKDNETGGHIQRMVKYSTVLSAALLNHPDPIYQVNSRFVRDIENNASVHDIGKVGIPDEILKKPGKLNEDEWRIMKTHTTIGGDIFAGLKESLKIFNRDFYKLAEDIARYHHERWDGTGYPSGLASQNIPLAARIVAIADIFDALTSKRVYKDAFSFEKSVDIINESAGSHLDPELVKVFNNCLFEFREIFNEGR